MAKDMISIKIISNSIEILKLLISSIFIMIFIKRIIDPYLNNFIKINMKTGKIGNILTALYGKLMTGRN